MILRFSLCFKFFSLFIFTKISSIMCDDRLVAFKKPVSFFLKLARVCHGNSLNSQFLDMLTSASAG
jgi:hypothetical protein